MNWLDNILKGVSYRYGRWQINLIGQRYFVIILSFLVGILSGLAAVALKHTISFVKMFVVDNFADNSYNLLLLASPAVGILITMLYVRYIVKDNLGHGITKILYAISKNDSNIKRHHAYSSVIASSFTIGFGGSVGAEAPIALTGAGIGSNIGKLFKMDYKTITLLVACGAAGGIGGAFKAPIAGMIFTLEILMLNLTLASIIPLLVSAVTATSITFYFLGSEAEFGLLAIMPFKLRNMPFYIMLGIFTGLVSLIFTRGTWFCEKKMGQIKNPYVKWIFGSVVIGLLVFLFPPLYGEGYSTIGQLLNNQGHDFIAGSPFSAFGNGSMTMLLFAAGVMAFKIIATSLTTTSGGVGGTFAPSLMLGGVAGYFFSLLNNSIGLPYLPQTNFTLVGMAGVMSGVMHAPLTSIFLIAEITNGYQLLLPLMLTATVSYLTIGLFEKHSIYTKPLAEKGELLTHERDKTVLTLMHLDRVIETDFTVVHASDSFGSLVQVISKSERNLFPVVNDREEMIGVVLLNDIRKIMFDRDRYSTMTVRDVMMIPPDFISKDESMESVMDKFERTQAWNLPVIDNNRYVGFVSKSKIFSVYRRVLTHVAYE
ncbi:MAG: chloride channel protein [Bacteroidales bacterium]|nr:chloride channel protein [Bacteroidales bacterium]